MVLDSALLADGDFSWILEEFAGEPADLEGIVAKQHPLGAVRGVVQAPFDVVDESPSADLIGFPSSTRLRSPERFERSCRM